MLRLVRSFTVLSFMSQWGGSPHKTTTSSSAAPSPGPASPTPTPAQPPSQPPPASHSLSESANDISGGQDSPSAAQQQRQRSDTGRSSRPMSMIQTYQPPIMQVGQDTLPELQRIFTFLNSHSNKLYQEGYFLKFHDTDTRTS
jgi:CCR4-NOT transcriptional complex subunit CAF120